MMTNIKKLTAIACISIALASCDTVSQMVSTLPASAATSGGITQTEAASGIKEALAKGVTAAVLNLNQKDGFLGSNAYKLFLPEDALKVESTLRNLGLGSQVDKAITQINRSAEDAMSAATPIFTNAIKQMSITDALNIVKGGSTSATDYFKSKTKDQLIAAFAPSIKASLDKTSATKYYSTIINTYNALPVTKNKINPDLQSYVVGKATDALFDQISKEEVAIRTNPVERTTDILKKVFGSATK